jgi:hypothetical protein
MNLTDRQILALAAFFSPVAVTGLLLAVSRGHWLIVLAATSACLVLLASRLRRHRMRRATRPATGTESRDDRQAAGREFADGRRRPAQ